MIVYLNGSYMPIEQAQISVLDRGFIFGDGVYEVIPVYSRYPFRLTEHLRRLQHSLEGICIPNPHSESEWASIILELIAHNFDEDQYLYLQITRGVAQRDLAFPNPPGHPTVFLMSNPLPTPSPELLRTGVSAVTATDNRWMHCDIKAISLLPNVLLRQLAVDANCTETILFRDATYLTEGTASNIFVVNSGTLLAPPKDHLMLPGITYDVILEIAAAHDIPHQVRRIYKDEVLQADELLMSSSTREIMPITKIDGRPVANGRPGKVFADLHARYQSFKQSVMRSHRAFPSQSSR